VSCAFRAPLKEITDTIQATAASELFHIPIASMAQTLNQEIHLMLLQDLYGNDKRQTPVASYTFNRLSYINKRCYVKQLIVLTSPDAVITVTLWRSELYLYCSKGVDHQLLQVPLSQDLRLPTQLLLQMPIPILFVITDANACTTTVTATVKPITNHC
jgi:hypothetical protein